MNVNFYPLIIVDKLDENCFKEKKNKQQILGLKFVHNLLEDVKELYVDYEIAEILSALIKDKNVLKKIKVNERGEVEMCEYIVAMRRKERKLGKREGKRQGKIEDRCETLIK